MDFFYDLFNKYKNYIISFVIVISLLVINDILIIYVFNKPQSKSTYDVNNKIAYKSGEDLNQSKPNSEVKLFKVDIKGEVKKPGVYEVDETMNVNDAINMAGGLTKKATTNNINLSKYLKDQMVIIIPNKNVKTNLSSSIVNCGQKSSSNSSNANTSSDLLSEIDTIKNDATIDDSDLVQNQKNDTFTTALPTYNHENSEVDSSSKLISINSASLEELQNIPGIGESKAKKIIEYREENCFNSIEDIMNVSGIGNAVFEKIKDFITI